MNDRHLEAELRAANPVSRRAVDAMPLEAGEEEMLTAIAGEMEPQERAERSMPIGPGIRNWLGGLQLSRRPIALAGAAAVAAAVFLVAFSTGGGPVGRPATAAAAIEHLANVSPTILVEGDGWRIEGASETYGREGSMSFIRGTRPQSDLLEREGPGFAFSRFAELLWRAASAREVLGEFTSDYLRIGSAPVLGTRAQLLRGNPGGKFEEYIAIWDDGGRALLLRGNYTDVSVLRKRLSALRVVAADRWAAALLHGEVVTTKAGVSVQPPK
jgi:hypothetical protein